MRAHQTKGEPPNWDEGDALELLFSNASRNERVTAANFPGMLKLLGDINRALTDCREVAGPGSARHLVPVFLWGRSHSAYLAACRLAMSGQHPEAFPVIRAQLEQSWYAFHIAMDESEGLDRVTTWLRRNEDAETRKRCIKEFAVGNVRATHALHDSTNAADVNAIYEELIDFGAHPNPLGVLGSIRHTVGPEHNVYHVSILGNAPTPTLLTLRYACAIAISSLRMMELARPLRFKITDQDTTIAQLRSRLTPVFAAARASAPPDAAEDDEA